MSNKLSKLIKFRLERLLLNVGDMSLKRRARRIIEELDPKFKEKIIDIGCGTGYYLFLLSNVGVKLKLIGLDNDQKAISEAKGTLDKRIRYIKADLMKTPFSYNTFDKAVMSEVLEHLPDDLKSLKEIRRILKPKGILVITTPSIDYPFLWDPINWILQHLFNTHVKSGFWAGIWNQHTRLYNKEKLEDIIERAGFKVERIEELTYWCLPFNHYLVNLVARFLYDYKVSKSITNSLSKFKTAKKPLFIRAAFSIINFIDGFNDSFPRRHGVNIFIKAVKE